MNKTKIEWTEKVWNPSVGCDKVSDGCKNCYAEKFAYRLRLIGSKDYNDGFKFKILPHRLEEPLKIKKTTKFFVNSMSDLFHEKMPFEYLDKVFNIIRDTPQHVYQILTKRDKVMLNYFSNRGIPRNVWLGVSVENNQCICRIENLKKINATIRFISFEPLIGSVGKINLNHIHWAIVGGESGNNARPMKPEWVEEIYDTCKEYDVEFFFKQWGTWGKDGVKRNKNLNGRIFKDREWNNFPNKELIETHS